MGAKTKSTTAHPEGQTLYTNGNPIELKSLCGAKTRSGRSCRGAPMLNGRCRLHGGPTPKGIANPNFTTGKYSKYLPGGLAQKYTAASNDADLISLREEIALVDTYLNERLERIYSGESEDLWKALAHKLTSYEKALSANLPIAETHLENLKDDIRRGYELFTVFEQLQPMLEQRRKLVESESKRLKDLGQNISVEKAMSIIALLASIVKRHVTDRDQLRAISTELAEAVA